MISEIMSEMLKRLYRKMKLLFLLNENIILFRNIITSHQESIEKN